MKAAVVKEARRMVIEDLPVPEAGPHEVVVKVKYVGICGSDLHLYKDGLLPPDCVMGHEATGIVASVGPEVTGWKVGDRTWLGGGGGCGKCEACLRNDFENCKYPVNIGMGILPGAYAEYIKVPFPLMIPLPEDVGLKEGTLLDPLTCAYHALAISGIRAGNSALVIGAGPIGLCVVACLKLFGAKPVILSEPTARRAELGRELGADVVINPRTQNLEEKCRELTNDIGPDMVFECVGVPTTILDSVSLVRKQGKVIWVGFCAEEVTFNPALWWFKNIAILMSFGAVREDLMKCLKLIQDRRVPVEKLVSEIISLDELPRAFERLLSPNTEVKILVEF